MNVKNNKRRQQSQKKIENAFVMLLQDKDLNRITVADICKIAKINRSTFYANFTDLYALADFLRDRLEQDVNELYGNDVINNCGSDYLRLFKHIYDNQIFYNTYFKLGYDNQHYGNIDMINMNDINIPKAHIEYHIQFHKAGLNAIIKMWLAGGCKESPEEMYEIIKSEYRSR